MRNTGVNHVARPHNIHRMGKFPRCRRHDRSEMHNHLWPHLTDHPVNIPAAHVHRQKPHTLGQHTWFLHIRRNHVPATRGQLPKQRRAHRPPAAPVTKTRLIAQPPCAT